MSVRPLPSGTIAFLMTDIVGSTRLWEFDRAGMDEAIERHNALIEQNVETHDGTMLKNRGEGDAVFCVFDHPAKALLSAIDTQLALRSIRLSSGEGLGVRMAIHSGEAALHDGDYYGPTVNRCARIRTAMHGGQIILSDAAHALALEECESIEFIDLGFHRLKDLQRPERLWQAAVDGLPSDFPPLASLDHLPNNLPLQLSRFVGREEELQAIDEAFGRSRLITLTGAGGSGKTRLSVQYAAEKAERFRDGVWLAELAAVMNADLLPTVVSTAMRLHGPISSAYDLARKLETKQALLVIDNCEHLAPDVAAFLEQLLSHCPMLHVIATSRIALDVFGEQCYSVKGLSLPTSVEIRSEASWLASDAVKLFLDKAVSVEPHFKLTPDNVPGVVKLCEGVDGLPLGIQLAAAKVRSFAVDEIVEERKHGLSILTATRASTSYRYASMEEAIADSYEPLTPSEKLLLNRLAVFSGGFSLPAARAVVCDESLPNGSLPRLLDNLILKSLVETTIQPDGSARYRLLEPIREFIVEHAPDPSRDVAPRHFDWIYDLVKGLEEDLRRSVGPVSIAKIEIEHRNLSKALSWALENCECLRALEVATWLYRYWFIRGYIVEGRHWIEATIDVCEKAPDPIRAKAWNALGVFAYAQGEFEVAKQRHEKALGLRTSQKDAEGIASSLSNLGIVARASGDLAQAHHYFGRALDAIKDIPASSLRVFTLVNLGCSLIDAEKYEEARNPLEEAVKLGEALSDHQNLCIAAYNLGEIDLKQGRLESAGTWLRTSLEEAVGLMDRLELANVGYLIALLAHEVGDLRASARILGGAQAFVRAADATPNKVQSREWDALAESLRSHLDPKEVNHLIHVGQAHRAERSISDAREFLNSQLVAFSAK